MKPLILWLIAIHLAVTTASAQEAPNPRALTWQEFASLPAETPVIIDNDSFYDVPGHYYLFGLASLGKVNLKGVIGEPASDRERDPQRLKQTLRDLQERIDVAKKSGMRNIPDAVAGSLEDDCVRPASSIIEETRVVRTSPGSDLIVAEARQAARNGRKLLVCVGGAASTVAVAYLTDPSIADHIVVVAIGLNAANGLHEWGSWILSKRMKLAHYSTHSDFPNRDPWKRTPGEWWPQRAEDLLPQSEVDIVPDPLLKAELQRERDRWAMLFSQHADFVIEGFGDSEGYWILHDKSVYRDHRYARARWVKPGHHVLYETAADPGTADVLLLSLDHFAGRQAFFRVLHDAAVYHSR
jgi:hypothetical protein